MSRSATVPFRATVDVAAIYDPQKRRPEELAAPTDDPSTTRKEGRDMTDDERRSPLHDAQLAAGADIIWEDGWPWAMTVGDTAQNEYEAIRTATGLWDLSRP